MLLAFLRRQQLPHKVLREIATASDENIAHAIHHSGPKRFISASNVALRAILQERWNNYRDDLSQTPVCQTERSPAALEDSIWLRALSSSAPLRLASDLLCACP